MERLAPIEFVPDASFDPEKPHQVGRVTVDPRRGAGAAPNNSNINYMGCVVWMTPGDFVRLNPPRPLRPGGVHVLLDQGGAVGPLTLYCNFEGAWGARDPADPWADPKLVIKSLGVHAHEGRGRAMWMAKHQPLVLVPVHLIIQPEVRARHIDPEGLLGKRIHADVRDGRGSVIIDKVTVEKRNYAR